MPLKLLKRIKERPNKIRKMKKIKSFSMTKSLSTSTMKIRSQNQKILLIRHKLLTKKSIQKAKRKSKMCNLLRSQRKSRSRSRLKIQSIRK